MKKKLFFFFILIVIFGVFVFIRFFYLNKKEETGILKIISSPNTSIFINNVATGRTPFEDRFPADKYIIKLIPEGTATDTASWSGKVSVYKNALTYISRDLGSSDISSSGEIFTIIKMEHPPTNAQFGEIYVETEPQGSIVHLDNDEKGVSPAIMKDIPKGDHELSISMPGFFSRTRKINIVAGHKVNAYIKLSIDESQKKLQEEKKEKEATDSAELNEKEVVIIKNTPSGWLRVREEPKITASESAQVNEDEKYDILEEKDGWYKIEYDQENEKQGWISGEYAVKQEENEEEENEEEEN